MQQELAEAIRSESERRLAREQRRAWVTSLLRSRFLKRSGSKLARKSKKAPPSWRSAPHFDPHHCRHRSVYLARGLWKSILAGTYRPSPAYRFERKKLDGGTRKLNLFSIPDAAVASVFMRVFNKRFATRFSSSSYAYRQDRNPQIAAADLARTVRGANRLFVAEIDFSKYFDSINHDYLRSLIAPAGKFALSRVERQLVEAVLRYDFAERPGTWPPPTNALRTNPRGIAQGHSLSLFLANLAAAELDDRLEALGVQFFRYADDIVVLSRTYDALLLAVEQILAHCARAGLDVNTAKSPGIRLLSTLKNNEMPCSPHIEFLGYSVSAPAVSLKAAVMRRIRRRLATIIFNNLISLPRRGFVNRRRLGTRVRDWDLMVCLNRLRRYIYGRQSEATISATMTHRQRLGRRSGVVAYFPVVDCVTPWQELDGWLLNVLVRAHRMRARILAGHGIHLVPVTEADLLAESWVSDAARKRFGPYIPLPSFVRAWRSCRREYLASGLGAFPPHVYPYGSAGRP